MPAPLSLVLQPTFIEFCKTSVGSTNSLQPAVVANAGDSAQDAAATPAAAVTAADAAQATEVLQNSIKVGCNTRLKGVGNLPHKTDLKLYFELGLKG